MTKKQIAEAFSNGKFELTFPYLAENADWSVIGEKQFTGKQEIIKNCEQTAAYFQSVTTDFRTLNVIEQNNLVAINGTAAFIKDNQQVAFVSACDLYEFDDKNQLQKITSYCIEDK